MLDLLKETGKGLKCFCLSLLYLFSCPYCHLQTKAGKIPQYLGHPPSLPHYACPICPHISGWLYYTCRDPLNSPLSLSSRALLLPPH